MRVLLDINVLLDVVLARTPWHLASARVLAAVEHDRLEGCVAGHTLPTIHYVVMKSRGRDAAAAAVTDFLGLVDVIPVETADFQRALVLPIDDFEDAVQAAAGLRADVEHIVTRNERDFASGPVPPIRPEELLAVL
ncbi:MAG: PIN domain-containing protein [Gemmatimonadota bacterium]|nr:PIN domain-containing protein [Gemmatimonadota bacterium]